MNDAPLIDHMGWRLFQAFSAWKTVFNEKMAERGCSWMAEARGGLIQHIGPGGIGQNDLATKSGMTKQAVQQQLDDLVRDGVVERVSDPADARRKRIQLTSKGKQAAHIANDIKQEIEAEIREDIGAAKFSVLMEALNQVAQLDAHTFADRH